MALRAGVEAMRAYDETSRAYGETFSADDEIFGAHVQTLRAHDETFGAHVQTLRAHDETFGAHAEIFGRAACADAQESPMVGECGASGAFTDTFLKRTGPREPPGSRNSYRWRGPGTLYFAIHGFFVHATGPTPKTGVPAANAGRGS